jgi:hypothetical protein
MKGGVLYDDYTSFDYGTILYEYDKHIYLCGHYLTVIFTITDLTDEV